MKAKIPLIVSSLMIGICIIIGFVMFWLGIRDTVKLNAQTKGYETVEGYFIGCSVYSEGQSSSYKNSDSHTTYRLIYSYTVDGQEYTVATEYGTELIPKENSAATIKYDPADPKEAIISGKTTNYALLFFAVMFTAIPLIILIGMLYSFGYIKNLSAYFMDIVIGLTLIVVGLGAIYLMTGTFKITGILQSFNLLLMIPIMFVVIGAYQIIYVLFFKRRKDS